MLLSGLGYVGNLIFRARSDVAEIEVIKVAVKQQQATIDMIVRGSNVAYGDINKARDIALAAQGSVEKLDAAVVSAKRSLDEIKQLSDFNYLILRANADDRQAFTVIAHYSDSVDHPYKQISDGIISSIASTVRERWPAKSLLEKLKIDPKRATLDQIKSNYVSDIHYKGRAGLVFDIGINEVISRKEKLIFLREVLLNDPSLWVADAACRVVDEEAKLGKNVYGFGLYVNWINQELLLLP